MLVDQENADIFPLFCESVERFLDGSIVCLAVNNKEVLLGVRWFSDVLIIR